MTPESSILGSYHFILPVRSGVLAGSEQVFSTVVGELLFIWKVNSVLGIYSLSFYYLRIFVFVFVCFPLDLVTVAFVSACMHSKSSADDLVP